MWQFLFSVFFVLKIHRIRRKGKFIKADSSRRNRVRVSVPATVANMGPGFDCIGMAIDIWNEIIVERSDHFEIISSSEDCDIPLDETNLVCVGVQKVFELMGQPLPVLKYVLSNRIPSSRGLGSSSAAIVGGLVAGFALLGCCPKSLDRETIFNLAVSIEGHPDNVAPAIYGGIRIGIPKNRHWISSPVSFPLGLYCICFITDHIGKTSLARSVLIDVVPREDALFNIGRVAWLINSLSRGDLHELGSGTEDRLHQPQRGGSVYPHLQSVLVAANDAGALCAFLSGAGPTVMALSHEKELADQIGQAMSNAGFRCGTTGKIVITTIVSKGVVFQE